MGSCDPVAGGVQSGGVISGTFGSSTTENVGAAWVAGAPDFSQLNRAMADPTMVAEPTSQEVRVVGAASSATKARMAGTTAKALVIGNTMLTIRKTATKYFLHVIAQAFYGSPGAEQSEFKETEYQNDVRGHGQHNEWTKSPRLSPRASLLLRRS